MSSCRASVGSRSYFDRPCVPVWSGLECQLFRQFCVHVQGAIHVTSLYQTTRQLRTHVRGATVCGGPGQRPGPSACRTPPGPPQPRRTKRDQATVAHQMHYIPGLALELAPRELNKAIASQLTTFPLPSSSGGFAFTTDPATGEVRLRAATFGPVFADRALTIGKGRFDFGLAFQPVKFDSFETAELTGGTIRFFLEHNNCCVRWQQRAEPADRRRTVAVRPRVRARSAALGDLSRYRNQYDGVLRELRRHGSL